MSTTTWIVIGAIIAAIILIILLIIAVMMIKKKKVIPITPVVTPITPVSPIVTPVTPRYIELIGQDHAGNDIIPCRTDLADNIPVIEELCNNTPGCVAFNSLGCIKSVAGPTVPSSLNFYYKA